jgi:PAS domain S-box-containing protein
MSTRIEKLSERISELEEENGNLRRLDETVRRNNALFNALLVNCSAGITLTGPDRRIVRVVRGLTGIDAAQLAGVPLELLVVPEDRDLVVECYRRLLRRTCEKTSFEARVPRADGTITRFSLTLTDMLDDPNVQGIVCNYVDLGCAAV